MQVRLIAGEVVRRGTKLVQHDYQNWVAGKVPVGAVGALRSYVGGDKHIMLIEWHGIQPKTGYFFGLTLEEGKYLPSWLEQVKEPKRGKAS